MRISALFDISTCFGVARLAKGVSRIRLAAQLKTVVGAADKAADLMG